MIFIYFFKSRLFIANRVYSGLLFLVIFHLCFLPSTPCFINIIFNYLFQNQLHGVLPITHFSGIHDYPNGMNPEFLRAIGESISNGAVAVDDNTQGMSMCVCVSGAL